MDTPLIELNEIEQLYEYKIHIIKNTIIEKIENKNITHVNSPLDECNDISESETWHDYLLSAQYALSGDYPDEECVEHAIHYGSNMLNKCTNILYKMPVNMLKEIIHHIDDHILTHRCSLCKD